MLIALLAFAPAAAPDPFAFFEPTVTVSASDRARLDGGEPVSHVLPADNREVAIWAAVPAQIDGDRLVAWIRRIEAMKKSSYVLAIRRFSDPPRLEDLAGLTLDADDLAAIRRCRPHDCGMKLSAAEMTALQAAPPGDEQQEFRRLVLARARQYLANGATPSYDDEVEPTSPAQTLMALLGRSAFLSRHVPAFADGLRPAADRHSKGVETFLYWSKEKVADKPIVSVTDVHILRSTDPALPDTLIAGRQIFATHYISASLGVTALMRGAPGGPHYLVYVNRSEVDVLHGMFGGLIRWFAERRLKAEAADVLVGLRQRLESGPPE